MRPLHIIMPMAGEGSRFLKEGWTTPKPLIKLHDKELFLRAIGSVKVEDAPMKYSFIVRQEHIDKCQTLKTMGLKGRFLLHICFHNRASQELQVFAESDCSNFERAKYEAGVSRQKRMGRR